MNRALAVLLVLALTPSAWATATTSWSASTAEQLAEGTLDGTAIDRDGRVRLAPERMTLFGPDDGIVWQVRPSGDDAAFVAMSGPGRVLRLAGGDEETWYRAEGEALVTALDVDAEGRPIFAVSPNALVLRGEAADRPVELAGLQAAFVWALLADGDDVWIGTGTPGGLLRLDSKGRVETVFDAGDDSVRCIARRPGGGVVLGTGGRGRVVRIDGAGRAFVLYDAEESEIVSVAVAADGTVWALAARGSKQISGGPSPPPSPADVTVRVTASAPPSAGDDDQSSGTEPSERPPTTGQRTTPQAFRLPPGGALYRIDTDGNVRRVWNSKRELPFALVLAGEDRLLVATGDEGTIYELDRDGRAARLLRIASSQASALALAPGGDTLVGGTTDARVERISAGPRSSGRYVGPTIDAGFVADWGRVDWDADVPSGAGLVVEARAGNTDEPDATWTDWGEIDAGDGQSGLARDLPSTRYLQLRFTLSSRSAGASPAVRRVEQYYRPRNRAPEIDRFEVDPAGVVLIPAPVPSSAALGPLVADDPVSRRVAEGLTRGRSSVPMRRGWEPGARTFQWTADDPDDDRLRASIAVRREGTEAWILLGEDLENSHFSWDARAMPDGGYRARLRISDALDNPDGGGLGDERVGEVFLVDNSRPRLGPVEVERRGSAARLSFDAEDAGGAVASVEIAVDGDAWRPVDPLDGVADAARERYVVDVAPREGQTRIDTVQIRVIDTVGNLGGDVVVISGAD